MNNLRKKRNKRRNSPLEAIYFVYFVFFVGVVGVKTMPDYLALAKRVPQLEPEPSKPILSEPVQPEPTKPTKTADTRRAKVMPRTTGQTVTFGPFEWIFNPRGITVATVRQIEELSVTGEGPVRVIQWPAGKVVFENGEWLDPEQSLKAEPEV